MDNVGVGINEWVLVSCGGVVCEILGSEKFFVDVRVVVIIDMIIVDNCMIYGKKDEYCWIFYY